MPTSWLRWSRALPLVLALLALAGVALAVPAALATTTGTPPTTETGGTSTSTGAGTTTATGTTGSQVGDSAEDGAAQTLSGTLRGEDGPVPGVVITVRRDGEDVGEATSDEEGRWEIQIVRPGTYDIELDEESLPEGVELGEGVQNPLSVRVLSGQSRPVLFRLGAGAGGGVAAWEQLAQLTFNGLKIGLIIAITSVGLSLIFGTTGLINFAHGELVAGGAIVAWFLSVEGPELSLVVAGILAVVLLGLFGGLLERALFRPLRHRKVGLFQMLVITIGLSLLLQNLLLLWFGGGFRPYDDFLGQSAFDIGPIQIVPRELWIMLLAVLILVGIATMLQRTKIGKAMRAVADNRDLAESSGIDVERVILVVWILGVALAAVGGIFTGMIFQVDFRMGFRLLLLMFAGIILGGLGTAYGAIVGGIVVGLATEISVFWFRAELKNAWALAILIIVLLFRPQGILGSRERIG